MRRRSVSAAIALTLLVGCGSSTAMSAAERSLRVETTACGHASSTSGGAVIVDDGLVAASAHVVIGGEELTVSGPFGHAPAQIVALDTRSDLALLEVVGLRGEPVPIGVAGTGDVVRLQVDGEWVTSSVTRTVEVRIDGVRSTERGSRLGFEIDRRVELGDSGGGVFASDGSLVGVVFGRPLGDGDRSFVVRHEELQRLLEVDRSGRWRCDPEEHQAVPVATG